MFNYVNITINIHLLFYLLKLIQTRLLINLFNGRTGVVLKVAFHRVVMYQRVEFNAKI